MSVCFLQFVSSPVSPSSCTFSFSFALLPPSRRVEDNDSPGKSTSNHWIMKLRNSIFMKKAAQPPLASAILNENNRFALSPLLIRFLSMIILPARVSRSYNSDISSAKLESRLQIIGMSWRHEWMRTQWAFLWILYSIEVHRRK